MPEEPLPNNLKWLSPKKTPFSINGFSWFKEDKVYRRLPLKPEWKIPDAVNFLANNTAGGQIRFKSNTKNLGIDVILLNHNDMHHMTATGQCGFDCYTGKPGDFHYIYTTKLDYNSAAYKLPIFKFDEGKMRNIVLNFPLYQGVKEVLIGIDKNAKVEEAPAYKSNKKIIIYGTSITQGGCANRPGMAYTNILSRRFNYEFINLGFSGSGKGEPELARIISGIEDPLCYILDYDANAEDKMDVTLPEFIRILREKQPKAPVIVISSIKFTGESYRRNEKLCVWRRTVQKKTVEELKKNGDKNIFLIDGHKLLGKNTEECTVDGVHLTDLGFMSMADSLTPMLKKILHI